MSMPRPPVLAGRFDSFHLVAMLLGATLSLVVLGATGCGALDDLRDQLSGHKGTARPTPPDGGKPTPPDDKGTRCGSNVCGAGQFCCNPSCGICAPTGGACTQQFCEPAPAARCASDADCRAFSDYCTGCDCRALARGEPDPKCSGPGVRCFVDPCRGKTAVCKGGTCALAASP
jgi:hypothetical protein